MIASTPAGEGPGLVSVIMPVRNCAGLVGEQVAALLEQDYAGPWELIVVDNDSNDGSAQEVAAALGASSNPQLVRQVVLEYTERRGHASPRNHGVSASAGTWLAFCDADDVVDSGWLRALLGARNAMTITQSHVVPLAETSEGKGNEQLPTDPALPRLFGLPMAHTCGMLCERSLFEQLGGFDPEFDIGGADSDFSIRAQTGGGAKLAIAADAIYRVRARGSTGSAMGQAYKYGRTRVRLFARHQDVIPRAPSPWILLFRRLKDVARRSPDLFNLERRRPYLRMVANTTARALWSARLRVRYF